MQTILEQAKEELDVVSSEFEKVTEMIKKEKQDIQAKKEEGN